MSFHNQIIFVLWIFEMILKTWDEEWLNEKYFSLLLKEILSTNSHHMSKNSQLCQNEKKYDFFQLFFKQTRLTFKCSRENEEFLKPVG